MDLSKFGRLILPFLLIFSFVRGYGWLIPKISRLDTMRHFYYEIVTMDVLNENRVFVEDINTSNPFSSFAPLPRWKQRAVYDEIKKIPTLYGLKLVKVKGTDKKHVLEKRTLSGALSLYGMLEDFPLIIEEPDYKFHGSVKDRIWVFLRDSDKDINLPNTDEKETKLKYVTSVFLSSAVTCDILIE